MTGPLRTKEECLRGLAAQFAAGCLEQDERYAGGGAEAVARAAFVPGGRSVEELAAGYERLAEQARQRQRGNAA